MKLYLNRLWHSGYFVAGALLLLIGSGPLLVVGALAALGLTSDPNPNPVGLGILSLFSFWPGVALMLVGLARSTGRRP
jgi:hypothetical protein